MPFEMETGQSEGKFMGMGNLGRTQAIIGRTSHGRSRKGKHGKRVNKMW